MASSTVVASSTIVASSAVVALHTTKITKITKIEKPFPFHLLPIEMLEQILIAAGTTHHHAFMSVCRRWYSILIEWRYRHKLPTRRRMSYIKDSICSIPYLTWSLRNGLSLFINTNKPGTNYVGNWDIIPSKYNLITKIIKKGDLEMLKWIRNSKYIPYYLFHFTDDSVESLQGCFETSAKYGKVDILEWFINNSLLKTHKIDFDIIVSIAIEYKHLEIIKLLYNKKYLEYVCAEQFIKAISCGFCEALPYLHKEHYKTQELPFITSLMHKHEQCAQWLIDNNYKRNLFGDTPVNDLSEVSSWFE